MGVSMRDCKSVPHIQNGGDGMGIASVFFFVVGILWMLNAILCVRVKRNLSAFVFAIISIINFLVVAVIYNSGVLR